jgi:hypothetical protein
MQGPSNNDDLRGNIINIVKTPLGFFVLIVLVVEAILGITANSSAGSDKTFLIQGMVVLIFLLVAIVALTAIFRPASLYGLPTRSTRKSPEAVYKELIRTIPDSVEKLTQFLDDICAKKIETTNKHYKEEIRMYKRQIQYLTKEIEILKKWLEMYSPASREPEEL